MTAPVPRPPHKELARAYEELGSIPAVAARYGVAYETARRWLKQAGVEFRAKGRPSPRATNLDVEELIERYKSGESLATIGKALGVAQATVRTRLLEAGVALRQRRGWPPASGRTSGAGAKRSPEQ